MYLFQRRFQGLNACKELHIRVFLQGCWSHSWNRLISMVSLRWAAGLFCQLQRTLPRSYLLRSDHQMICMSPNLTIHQIPSSARTAFLQMCLGLEAMAGSYLRVISVLREICACIVSSFWWRSTCSLSNASLARWCQGSSAVGSPPEIRAASFADFICLIRFLPSNAWCNSWWTATKTIHPSSWWFWTNCLW